MSDVAQTTPEMIPEVMAFRHVEEMSDFLQKYEVGDKTCPYSIKCYNCAILKFCRRYLRLLREGEELLAKCTTIDPHPT